MTCLNFSCFFFFFSDLENGSTIIEVDHSNNAGTETTDNMANSTLGATSGEVQVSPLKRSRGRPKGVPRGVKSLKKTVPKSPVGKKRRKKWKRTVIIPKKVSKYTFLFIPLAFMLRGI